MSESTTIFIVADEVCPRAAYFDQGKAEQHISNASERIHGGCFGVHAVPLHDARTSSKDSIIGAIYTLPAALGIEWETSLRLRPSEIVERARDRIVDQEAAVAAIGAEVLARVLKVIDDEIAEQRAKSLAETGGVFGNLAAEGRANCLQRVRDVIAPPPATEETA